MMMPINSGTGECDCEGGPALHGESKGVVLEEVIVDSEQNDAAEIDDSSDGEEIEMTALIPGPPDDEINGEHSPKRRGMGLVGVMPRVLLPASPVPHQKRCQDHGDESVISSTSDFSESAVKGTATPRQVAINIFISFVGAGLLGMPYAFSRSGWLLGSITLSAVSFANIYSMMLLVKTRKRLEMKGHTGIRGYGDLGRVVLGPRGEMFVNLCLVISQVGFATAYIIFIAANLERAFDLERLVVCFACVPVLALLVQAQEMKTLSPFSLIADCANLVGLSAVLFQDFEYYHHGETIKAVDWSNLLYVAAVSIYSLEGVALVLPLESSAVDREGFPRLLSKVIMGITLLMVVFGVAGFVAFGSQTQAPITLNLDGSWAIFVQLALCLALYLTYPIMMFPVNDVMEESVLPESVKRPSRQFRIGVVFLTAAVAYSVPDFGKFLGLVGSSICTILGFILPPCVHLLVFGGNEISLWEKIMDTILILFGAILGIFGTYSSVKSLLSGSPSTHA